MWSIYKLSFDQQEMTRHDPDKTVGASDLSQPTTNELNKWLVVKKKSPHFHWLPHQVPVQELRIPHKRSKPDKAR